MQVEEKKNEEEEEEEGSKGYIYLFIYLLCLMLAWKCHFIQKETPTFSQVLESGSKLFSLHFIIYELWIIGSTLKKLIKLRYMVY